MSTGVIIVLIVAAAAVVAVVAILAVRARGPHGGHGLKRRFGPEYDRAVARHNGDVKAAEDELGALVERHGGLHERPLEPAERERFEARWTAAQESFVDSPRTAVAEADQLLAEVAGARGFPDGAQYEEQLAALSVHHADHVHGYRRVHSAARVRTGGSRDADAPGTEDLRAAMVEARALFGDLIGSSRGEPGRHRARTSGPAVREDHSRSRSARHLPWGAHRQRTKEG